jgi:hypothetical protein
LSILKIRGFEGEQRSPSMSFPAIDVLYIDELSQMQKAMIERRKFYDEEIEKLEEQFRRDCQEIAQKHLPPQGEEQGGYSTGDPIEDFICAHPSSAEVERRSCIEQLSQSEEWRICDDISRCCGCWYLRIARDGFPPTILVYKLDEKPSIPAAANRLAEKYSFRISIAFKGKGHSVPL